MKPLMNMAAVASEYCVQQWCLAWQVACPPPALSTGTLVSSTCDMLGDGLHKRQSPHLAQLTMFCQM